MKSITSPKNNRNTLLDNVKAFAIVCMVLGHCIQFGSGSHFEQEELYFLNPVFKFIYSFHMPLFMLISGYLFAFSVERRSWQENFRKKITSLIVPIFTWALLPLCISVVSLLSQTKGHLSFRESIDYYLFTSITHLWFLWAIFWCSIVILIVHRFFKDRVWIYALCVLLSLFLPDSDNWGKYGFMLPYYLLGYYYNRMGNAFKQNIRSSYLLLFIGGIFVILLFFFNRDSYIYTSGYCILRNPVQQLLTNVFRFSIGLFGSLTVILFFSKIKRYICRSTHLSKVFSELGKETMGIYIVSEFLISIMLRRYTKDWTDIHYGALIVESLFILCLSFVIIQIIRKSTFLNRILLGAR